MTDWSFKASDWKCLVYTSTSDVCSLFFVNCDVHHIKFIIYRKRRLKKVGGGGGVACSNATVVSWFLQPYHQRVW